MRREIEFRVMWTRKPTAFWYSDCESSSLFEMSKRQLAARVRDIY